jgi:hypothetical protein
MEISTKPRKEGRVAKAIEKQTSKIPSDVFLWAAGASMAGSLMLRLMKKNSQSTFVGQWAAPLLILGLYNKLVKVQGHDEDDKGKTEDFNEDKW